MNRLTARWARNVTDGTAISAAGVWPLLDLLTDGAGGAARAEPADAVGLTADQAAGAARELVAAWPRRAAWTRPWACGRDARWS
ncbi:hypothetical protein [Streptomyces sp. NPDC059861]|uniref:hypothetical protein n=1 Tax=Streptomyces sp. NPDC059861 TaxID=3346974 RepID=UPI003667DBF5